MSERKRKNEEEKLLRVDSFFSHCCDYNAMKMKFDELRENEASVEKKLRHYGKLFLVILRKHVY